MNVPVRPETETLPLASTLITNSSPRSGSPASCSSPQRSRRRRREAAISISFPCFAPFPLLSPVLFRRDCAA
ncbi:hypothetical protein SKAU_G00182100 [Synaphobranchus kaupii]|uniref:Uncharacterized protein n=1 Tax=Synaphobranchus kaupii TaxID=118154 RepID=A0A9Q1FC33_SYNKA|nr:hypothetical protein SKAU_G00182100 [Synaphobranchus kaupii]